MAKQVDLELKKVISVNLYTFLCRGNSIFENLSLTLVMVYCALALPFLVIKPKVTKSLCLVCYFPGLHGIATKSHWNCAEITVCWCTNRSVAATEDPCIIHREVEKVNSYNSPNFINYIPYNYNNLILYNMIYIELDGGLLLFLCSNLDFLSLWFTDLLWLLSVISAVYYRWLFMVIL